MKREPRLRQRPRMRRCDPPTVGERRPPADSACIKNGHFNVSLTQIIGHTEAGNSGADDDDMPRSAHEPVAETLDVPCTSISKANL